MSVEFTAHNIRLDDGTYTMAEPSGAMDSYHRFVAARRIIETVFPGDKAGLRLVDLGCLEGGYTVEFARMGLQATGIEVREANFRACQYVRDKVDLPNLRFVKDDAWNVARHGPFDIVFCCGLFYHLDRPKAFLDVLSQAASKLLILQTHFAPMAPTDRFPLSPLTEHEGVPGRWCLEYADDEAFARREEHRWTSWDNKQSFWIRREFLLDAIRDAGFDVVLEQFDGLYPTIAGNMLDGEYRIDSRGTFIGIKTGWDPDC
jgi:SAM-dependent methyltransferase